MKNSKLFFLNLLFNSFFNFFFLFKYIFFFGFCTNLLILVVPLFSMQVLDKVLTTQNLDTLFMLMLISIFSLSMFFFIQIIRFFIISKIASFIEKKLSKLIFYNSINENIESNLYNGQSFRDLQTIKSFIASSCFISLIDLPWSLIFIIFSFFLHKYIGLLVILFIFILVTINLIFENYIICSSRFNNKKFFNSMNIISESISNSHILFSMSVINNVYLNWKKEYNYVLTKHNRTTILNYIFTETLKFIRLIIQIITLSSGSYLVIKGSITSGSIIASSYMVSRAVSPFEHIVNYWKTFSTFLSAYSRISILISKQVYLINKISFPLLLGELSVENIYFNSFINTKCIIKNLSFYLNSGEILGVFGNVGCGKTSLLKIIIGLFKPTVGSIKIDGLSLYSWKNTASVNNIGYLPQEIELFSDSIKKNISMMNFKFCHKRILVASKITGAHELIINLPYTYNYIFDKKVNNLSTGEKKIISLARVFYNFPKIIVLDEPESNLDFKQEEKLITAIFTAKEKNITMIIVTKSKSILNVVDKILIIKEGNMSSFGLAKDMMKKI